MKRLTIVDGNSLLFRAYYASAYPGTTIMRTKEGIPTNAIYIFSNMIVRILDDIVPGDGLLVAFDTGKKTFRHEQLESYKAQRKKAPDELIQQMPIAREFLASLGIFTFEVDGYEADDVAGTAAIRAHKRGIDVTMYTSDRDFLQLVNTTIKVHLIKRGMSDIRVMDRNRVIEDFGITPEQIPDYKGLCGDASDNLPGIPGIGDKTAVKLLNEYESFENILAHADDIKDKISQNNKQHSEMGTLCKKLAIIDTDVNLPFDLDKTVYEGYEYEAATTFGARYELKTFLRNLPSAWRVASDNPPIELTRTFDASIFDKARKIGLFLDYGTSNYHNAPLFGIALATKGATVYLTIEDVKKNSKVLDLLKDDKIDKYVFDLKATYVLLARNDISMSGPFHDILLASYTLDTSAGTTPESILTLYGAEFPKSENATLLEEGRPDYAGVVAAYLWRLWPKLQTDLDETQPT